MDLSDPGFDLETRSCDVSKRVMGAIPLATIGLYILGRVSAPANCYICTSAWGKLDWLKGAHWSTTNYQQLPPDTSQLEPFFIMPPRKKPVDGAPAAPTRSSARTKAAAATTPPPQAAAPVKVKGPAKPKSKRARANSASEDDAPASKPASKKAKTGKAKQEVKDEDKDDAAEDAQEDAAADDEPEEPKKMVTVLKRGAAPVDPNSGKVDTHMVYADNTVWDAMLNQTDGPWPPQVAIGEFKKQFKAKAAVNWEDRVGMVTKKGKYTWIGLERDYSDEDDSKDDEKAGDKEAPVVIPDSNLELEVQMADKHSLIDAHLSSMNYDAKKLPLGTITLHLFPADLIVRSGKLAKSTILSGFAALKTLSEVIEKPDGATAIEYGGFRPACEQLSGAYYSIIPHDFGRQRPTVISSLELLQKELNLVDALGDMEIASKLISSNLHADADGIPINPVDANFRSLGLSKMEVVPAHSGEFQTLESYVRDTHGATHRHIQVAITHAYRVERAAETEAWNKRNFGDLDGGERLLLWHGSRTTNFAGILKQGLRIAPPEAPVTGYMFGKGVYFADMMSKSAAYCYSHLSNNTGLLLLCEVAAKPFHELTHAVRHPFETYLGRSDHTTQQSYDADRECKSNKKLATKGIGRTQPVKWKDAGQALDNEELIGCQMPAGPGIDVSPPNVYLQYNEPSLSPMSKGKGKEVPSERIPVMLNPATGSANPAASLSALWAYLQPALEHIMKSPTNDTSGKAPSIDIGFYSGIHSACYNYFTAQSEAANAVARILEPNSINGTDLYERLDRYFADTTRELLLGTPHDDSALIHYIVPCFNRYTAGAQSVNRLLSYVNRHYVKRAVDEDKGWLRLSDVLESVAKTVGPNDTREKISKRLRDKRLDELKKWGYEDGGSGELLAAAEASAEAASPPDRIVNVVSLAHRRFRTEFFEPLLAVPKMKGKSKAKHKIPKAPSGSSPPGPKGRLARAVKELLESEGFEARQRLELATSLAKSLKIVGLRPDHALRKKLDKFVASVTKGA
ncbi:hypothetical protein DXG01_012499 [Tephrocybe rancida]|nr:hypothetical protein DXG01_012499 [Tephrocybe rancida]